VPFTERFVVGGINTVRGFEYGTAGPLSDSGDILGGNKELILNVEYVFPLVEQAKMKGLVFFDAGRAFDDNEPIRLGTALRTCPDGSVIQAEMIRYSAGFGLRMLLPIGPIRLEWGYNLDPQCNERQGLFPEFTIGTVF